MYSFNCLFVPSQPAVPPLHRLLVKLQMLASHYQSLPELDNVNCNLTVDAPGYTRSHSPAWIVSDLVIWLSLRVSGKKQALPDLHLSLPNGDI